MYVIVSLTGYDERGQQDWPETNSTLHSTKQATEVTGWEEVIRDHTSWDGRWDPSQEKRWQQNFSQSDYLHR